MTGRIISVVKVISQDKKWGYIKHDSENALDADYSFKAHDLINLSMEDLRTDLEVSFIPNEWRDSNGNIKRSASEIQLNNSKSTSLLNKDSHESDNASIKCSKPHQLPNKTKKPNNYLMPNGGIDDSELIIGIVSAVGTESKRVINPLKDRLRGFGYSVQVIKVSALLDCQDSFDSEEERIKRYMQLGDKRRKESQNNAILAAGAIKEITEIRDNNEQRRAYIIDSLKHPDEVEMLRKVYGDGFYLFGIHADEDRRLNYLTKDMLCDSILALELIKTDENESIKHGQKTRDTFHLADFFLNLGKNDDQVKNTIQRFLELIFSHPHKHPTFDEFAMFMAFNSSVRSGDLSRQVGAVLSRNKQILATGANDVPRSGGGLYWAKEDISSGEIIDDDNGKDCKLGEDSNKRMQSEIVDEILENIIDGDILQLSGDQEKALKNILKSSKIGDLTEFGRVVHAEMEAILSCGREGISTLDSTLYCTTFPCHNCAKHIIASGIKRVVYVEPYPKSKAIEFHSDSIELKKLDSKKSTEKVIFEPFIGVGSRRFLDLFSMSLGRGAKLKRKDKDGYALEWRLGDSSIRTPLLNKSYLEIENDAIQIWNDHS